MSGTEQVILSAAREIFQEKGFTRTKMQEIADKAGINRALVHYYFRSKQKLFETIFKNALDEFIPQLVEVLNTDLPLKQRVTEFVTRTMDISLNNPSLPLFIVTEINRNPEAVVRDILLERNLDLDTFFHDLAEIGKGRERTPNFYIHAFVSMISLTLYPFIGKTLITSFLGISDKDYPRFIEERKDEVISMVLKNLGFQA
jgi:AcrR family transcriptional regulator